MITSWLTKVRPPKYLRYFFNISYRWYTGYESERHSAHFTATLFLAVTHFFLILFLIYLVALDEFMTNTNKFTGTIPIFIFLAITHYFLFLYKDKWKKYVREFEQLTAKQRQKGTFLLIFYLLFSIVLSFSPFYFLEIERNKIREEKMKMESTRVYNSYGVALCTLADDGIGEDFVFFEFFVDGEKVKGATAIAKGSGEGMVGKYFRVNYSSRKNRENVLLVNDEVLDRSEITAAGFE